VLHQSAPSPEPRPSSTRYAATSANLPSVPGTSGSPRKSLTRDRSNGLSWDPRPDQVGEHPGLLQPGGDGPLDGIPRGLDQRAVPFLVPDVPAGDAGGTVPDVDVDADLSVSVQPCGECHLVPSTNRRPAGAGCRRSARARRWRASRRGGHRPDRPGQRRRRCRSGSTASGLPYAPGCVAMRETARGPRGRGGSRCSPPLPAGWRSPGRRLLVGCDVSHGGHWAASAVLRRPRVRRASRGSRRPGRACGPAASVRSW